MMNMNSRQAGLLLGLFSSATFGLIPLFTIPLLQAGISAQTALVYRFSIAVAVMGLLLWRRGENFSVGLRDLLKLMGLSTMYLLAVVLFFYAFSFMASGAVATIQFLYPVMVMLIMIVFFREPFHWQTALALALALAGVGLLSSSPDLEPALEPGAARAQLSGPFSDLFWGISLSLLAGLCNALYFVGIQVARIGSVSGLMMTFYVMLFGTFFCLANALATDSLQWISGLRELGLASLLAIVTAVLSNLALIMAIQRVGSTMTAILGVMEPLTAVAVGILVFGEPFTMELIGGVALIAGAVLLAIIGPGAGKN